MMDTLLSQRWRMNPSQHPWEVTFPHEGPPMPSGSGGGPPSDTGMQDLGLPPGSLAPLVPHA